MENEDFKKILNETGKKIFNYLFKILRNREDAEDIYQEVYFSFYKKFNKINPDYYETYLYKTAYHKALNFIKKQKRKQTLELYKPENLIYEDKNQEEQKSGMVKEAMQKLKPKEALLIELQYFQKKSYKEIAKILSISQSAVDSRLVRAKKKLRKIILQDYKDKIVYKDKERQK